MRVPLLILSVTVALCLTGCANYWANRGRDAADIITLQVGTGAGVKARVGPFQAGLLSENGLFGLRGGEFIGWSQYRAATTESPSKWDDVIFLVGAERFEGSGPLLERGKGFKSRQILLSIPFNLSRDRDYVGESPAPFNPWPYLTEIEAAGGAFLTFRVGANPGELLDFVLGWTTLDIYGDDIRADLTAKHAKSAKER
jgi:hypothetical protein